MLALPVALPIALPVALMACNVRYDVGESAGPASRHTVIDTFGDAPRDSEAPPVNQTADDTQSDAGSASVAEPPAHEAGLPQAMPSDAGVAEGLEVALLWIPSGLEDGLGRFEPSGLCPDGSDISYGGQVAQPIDVEVALPALVDISMLDAPPAEALVALSGGRSGGWTVGHLVLYRDGNGNGLLDPRNLEESSPDEILGTSGGWGLHFDPAPGLTSYVIYYSDEELPEYGPSIQVGFNVFRDVVDTVGSGERASLPVDTEIPILVRDTHQVKTMNCEEMCFLPDDFTCPLSSAELAEDPAFECFASLWSRTRCEGCFCFTATCFYEAEFCPAP